MACNFSFTFNRDELKLHHLFSHPSPSQPSCTNSFKLRQIRTRERTRNENDPRLSSFQTILNWEQTRGQMVKAIKRSLACALNFPTQTFYLFSPPPHRPFFFLFFFYFFTSTPLDMFNMTSPPLANHRTWRSPILSVCVLFGYKKRRKEGYVSIRVCGPFRSRLFISLVCFVGATLHPGSRSSYSVNTHTHTNVQPTPVADSLHPHQDVKVQTNNEQMGERR